MLGILHEAGVIHEKSMSSLRNGTELSGAGQDLIEELLVGKVFSNDAEAVRRLKDFKNMRRMVITAMTEIAANRTLKNGFSLESELSKAVELAHRAKKSMPDVYVDGMPVSPFGRQMGLFDDEFGDSRVTDATTLLLADILNSGKPSELRKVLASYNRQAAEAASGQVNMFDDPDADGVIKPRDREKYYKMYWNTSTMEQQKRNGQSSMPQSKTGSAGQPSRQPEARETMKLRMLLNSVQEEQNRPTAEQQAQMITQTKPIPWKELGIEL